MNGQFCKEGWSGGGFSCGRQVIEVSGKRLVELTVRLGPVELVTFGEEAERLVEFSSRRDFDNVVIGRIVKRVGGWNLQCGRRRITSIEEFDF